MKRFSYLMTLTLIVTCANAWGGYWEDELRVTRDPALQDMMDLAVAPDDTVYAVWPEYVGKDVGLYLIESGDKGVTWTSPALVMGPGKFSGFDLAADASGLHLSFLTYDVPGDAWFLTYANSADGGATWSKAMQVGGWQNIYYAYLYSGDGKLLIHALDGVGGHLTYLSDDVGATWVENTLLPPYNVESPDFFLNDGVIHAAFRGFLPSPIAYSYSADSGATWSYPVEVAKGWGAHSQCPSIVVDDAGIIHVAWEDDREGSFNVEYANSTDGGATFGANVRINDTFYGARTRLLADEDGLHIVWCQYHGTGWPGNWGSDDFGIVWYRFSDNAGVSWTDEFRVSQNDFIPPLEYPSKGANYAGIAQYDRGFCVCWQDKRDGNIDIYMRSCADYLLTDRDWVSFVTGGTVNFSLEAGFKNAGRNYLILGSLTGTKPGTVLPKGYATLPLNWDVFTDLTFNMTNTPVFEDFLGKLDGQGAGSAKLNVPAPIPGVAGVDMFYAFACAYPWDFVSNPVTITFTP